MVSTMDQLLYLWERHTTHRTGGWVGLGASLDGYGKISPPPGFKPHSKSLC